MESDSFDHDLIRNSRLVLCPSCDSESRVSLADTEASCDNCGEDFLIEEEFGEDFIWHPDKKF